MSSWISKDREMAASHGISIEEAVAYRRGGEARSQARPMTASPHLSTYGAWYAAGWHDRDIDLGVSVLEGRV